MMGKIDYELRLPLCRMAAKNEDVLKKAMQHIRVDPLKQEGAMIRAIVTGAGGRMGGRIVTLIAETDGIELAGAVERKGHPLIGKDVGEGLGLGRTGI